MANEERSPESESQGNTASYDLSELTESRENSDFGGTIYSAVTYLIAAVAGGIILSDIAVFTYTSLVSPDLTAISGDAIYSHEQAGTIFAIYAGSGLLGAVIGLVATYKAVHSYSVKRKFVIISAIGLLIGLFVLFRIVAVLI